MASLILSFLTSFICTMLIVRYKHLHNHLSGDWDLTGPQKFHNIPVPRIGGLCIVVGLVFGIFLKTYQDPNFKLATVALLCAIPVFAIGFLEDLFKNITVRIRLLFTSLSAILAIFFLNTYVTSTKIEYLDLILNIPFFSAVFTIFAITGVSNAYNIIDGFNGLASMVGIISLMAIAYLSLLFSDSQLFYLSTLMSSTIFGFFLWNYPRGLIFLGDGGAYLIGFWISCLSILLVQRHPEISPWFALLINAYPIIETLFTIYRRKILRKTSPGYPDGIHLHTLIYRRVLSPYHNSESRLTSNARTAPYLWLINLLAAIPALLYWGNTCLLALSFSIFLLIYLFLYKRIVTLKTPSFLKF